MPTLQLQEIPLWGNDTDANTISRTFSFRNFTESMGFANALAGLAEEQNHHPSMLIDFKTVALVLTTHSEGGVTEKDIELAKRIDTLVDA